MASVEQYRPVGITLKYEDRERRSAMRSVYSSGNASRGINTYVARLARCHIFEYNGYGWILLFFRARKRAQKTVIAHSLEIGRMIYVSITGQETTVSKPNVYSRLEAKVSLEPNTLTHKRRISTS